MDVKNKIKIINNDYDYDINYCYLEKDNLHILYQTNNNIAQNNNCKRHCLYVLFNIKNYTVDNSFILRYCSFDKIIGNYLYFHERSKIYRYNINNKQLININYIQKDEQLCPGVELVCFTRLTNHKYIFEYNTDVYYVFIDNNNIIIYNIIKDIDYSIEIINSISNFYYNDNKLYMVCNENMLIHNLDTKELKESNLLNNYLKIGKVNEKLLLLCSYDNKEKRLFDFSKFDFIDIEILGEQVTKNVSLSKSYNVHINYHYINKYCYLYNNYFIDNTIMYKNINFDNLHSNEMILLKSSISNKHSYIPKDILILRSNFFKELFKHYDTNEFTNEYFEDIEIYEKFILNKEIIDCEKLIKICLYLQEDIDNILFI